MVLSLPITGGSGRRLGAAERQADAMSSHPYRMQRQLGQHAVLPLPSRPFIDSVIDSVLYAVLDSALDAAARGAFAVDIGEGGLNLKWFVQTPGENSPLFPDEKFVPIPRGGGVWPGGKLPHRFPSGIAPLRVQ